MTLMDVKRRKTEATGRIINMRTGETWCPYYHRNVDVIGTCIDACQFYERIGRLSRVDCTWTDDDGEAEEG